MKKIACITYHASHNYGSNFQAYGLQKYVEKISKYDYKIINFRTEKQKNMYELFYNKKGIKYRIKSILFCTQKEKFKSKYKKFEEFINRELNVTKEYSTIEELKNENFDFDYFISGGDQIWNLIPSDFDWAYFLEFVGNGKKISYSASFGPKKIEWTEIEKERVKKDLEQYDYISVREEGSYNNVLNLINKKANINIDPAMLLDKEEWNKIINKEQFQKGDYIFLYDLKNKAETYKLAKKISKRMKLPVVVVQESEKTLFTKFIKRYDCGPSDFLNLIKNAKLVLSTSFHGNVFSIMFHKPFFAIGGAADLRIKNLLKTFGLEDRVINESDYENKIDNAFNISFSEADKYLEEERNNSEKYLKKALDIE